MIRQQGDVDLKHVLDQLKREVFLELNCHAVGKIDSFDHEAQTCKVEISYLKTRRVRNQSGNYVNENYSYPVLLDCPTMFLTGGESGLTMPVAQGDSCLVLFNDRDLDNWFNSGEGFDLASPRLHSISDAIAIVGIRNSQDPIANFDPDNPHLYNGDMSLKMKADKFYLSNGTDTLGVLLRNLVDAIKNLTTINCVVGAPVTISPASLTTIETAITAIEGMIE